MGLSTMHCMDTSLVVKKTDILTVFKIVKGIDLSGSYANRWPWEMSRNPKLLPELTIYLAQPYV